MEPAEASGTGSIYEPPATFSGPFTVGHVIEPLTALPTEFGVARLRRTGILGRRHGSCISRHVGTVRWKMEHHSDLVCLPIAPAFWCAGQPIAKKFSGTVIVEWMNESAGESAPDWDYLNPEIRMPMTPGSASPRRRSVSTAAHHSSREAKSPAPCRV